MLRDIDICTHLPKIKSISQIIVKKKWWQLYIWQNFKAQQCKLAKNHSTTMNFKVDLLIKQLSPHFFAMLGDIALIFGIWVYTDELQIKLTFRSGPMIFGQVMALELWNLAKVNISKYSEKKVVATVLSRNYGHG
jgi:hypothetical protein